MQDKEPNYLVLVNGEHRLPEDYAETIEFISGENGVGRHFQVEKKAYEAFLRLQEDLLKNDGIQTEIGSTYRTVEQQEEIYKRYRTNFGLEYAKKYVAEPGHSEHHTGIAIDIGIVIDGKYYHTIEELFSIEPVFEVIHKKLPKYGFILRYPKGKEAITGIGYEMWHIRYIDSPELATAITEQGICLEDYWKKR